MQGNADRIRPYPHGTAITVWPKD